MYTSSTKNIEENLPWNRKGGRDILQLIFNDEILINDMRDTGHKDANIILIVFNVFFNDIIDMLSFLDSIKRPRPENKIIIEN